MRAAKSKDTPVSRLLVGDTARNWLFLGDSITLGARHTHGWRDYTQLFTERVRYELRRQRDLVLNAAVDGSTAGGCLMNLSNILVSYKPDVAFVMIGTNDAAADRKISLSEFKSALAVIVARLREAGVRVILQTPVPIVPELAAPYRRKFDSIVRSIREVAAAKHVALIDHHKYWKTLFKGTNEAAAVSHMCDGIHPNAFGHALLAHHLFTALGIHDPEAASCRSFTPQTKALPQHQRQTNKK